MASLRLLLPRLLSPRFPILQPRQPSKVAQHFGLRFVAGFRDKQGFVRGDMVRTRSGNQVEPGEQMESGSELELEKGQKKIEDFVERVKGAEAEGGYDEESEPEPKRRRSWGKSPEGPKEDELSAPPETPAEGGAQPSGVAAPTIAKGGGESRAAVKEEGGKGVGAKKEGGSETGGRQQESKADEAQGGTEEGEEGAGPGELEKGRVYFFYRPKVSVTAAEGPQDVQRFFMVLRPSGEGAKARLAVIGKKRLPSVERKERLFGFIQSVSDSVADLTQGLGSQTYQTKIRGTREVSAARALGEGAYAILKHGDHTHLAYKLEVPTESEMGEVQEAFNMDREASYILSIKNPEHPSGRAVGLQDKAEYSPEKKREFRYYSWIGAFDPQLLDTERCEFLLVGAADDLHAELKESGSAVAEAAGEDVLGRCPDSDEECLLEKMKGEIGAEEAGIEMEPAATGEWK